jgi:hypothetical protein
MFQPKEAQVLSLAPDGHSDPRYLGTNGHVGALTYGWVYPGGCDNLTCNLMQTPLSRYQALNPGRVLKVYRGASCVWEGKLNEPVESTTGWALQAYGNGHYGDDYMSYHTNYGQAGDPVIKAVAGTPSPRVPLRWQLPATWPGGLYLQQPPDSASVTITDYLNNVTGPAGMGWYVGRGNILTVGPPPSAVNRLLVVTEPQARTLAGYFTWLWLRYQSSAQNTTAGGTNNPGSGAAQFSLTSVQNAAQLARHGAKETYGDLSQAGTLSNNAASNIGTSLMAKYQAANYGGTFTIYPGQLLTVGGAPVDIGCEQAGTVVRVLMASGGYGGDVAPSPPLTFITGALSYNDETELGSLTPYLGVAGDLATLLSNYTTVHTPKSPQSSWAIPYHP